MKLPDTISMELKDSKRSTSGVVQELDSTVNVVERPLWHLVSCHVYESGYSFYHSSWVQAVQPAYILFVLLVNCSASLYFDVLFQKRPTGLQTGWLVYKPVACL